MIAARLSMVRSHDQQRLLAEHRGERLTQRVVDVRDLPEVRIIGVLSGEGLGRAVGGMRIVEVDPHEPFFAGVRAPPSRRSIEDCSGGPLLNHEVECGLPFSVVVVVEIESLIQSESRVERKRADERAGGVPILPQRRRDGCELRIEPETGVVANSVLVWIQTGQYVDM